MGVTSDDDSDFERLLDWAEGRLGPAEAAAVDRAVAVGDASTRAAVAWVEGFLRAAEAGTAAEPPAYLHELLIRRFEDRMRVSQPPGLVERLRAALTFDSGLGAAPAGARGVLDTAGTERHLVYSTPALDLALDLYAADEGVRVDGQVLPADQADDAVATLRLLRGDAEVAATTADDLGEFTLARLPPGPYRLLVTIGWLEVAADLELGL